MSSQPARSASLFRRPELRLAVFGLAAVAAVYFGFIHFPVSAALTLVREGGYYAILLTFVLWVLALWLARWRPREEPPPVRPARRDVWLGVGLIAGLTSLALNHETFRSKILYDEYVLQSTAYNMHFFRDNAAMVRGYDIQGVFLSTDSYVDKRPAFFAFLLSLVHDLVGYRPENVFGLNAGLFVASLGLASWLGWRVNGRLGGFLAASLLGSLPLFAQNATGAGMELLNVCMLLVVMLAATAWLARPDEPRLSAFVLAVVLLVQSRYESALYVLPAAAAILLGWWWAKRVVVSWAVLVAPLLFIPVALQQKVISNSPIMWELRENQTSRFSVEYLADNLRAAWAFFSSWGITQPNSLFLAPAGLIALLFIAWKLSRMGFRPDRLTPLQASLLFFGAGILSVTGLIMFYYWAGFNDPMAARFALPLHVLFVLAVVTAAASWDRRWPASWAGLIAAALFILGSSAPKQSYHFYSHSGNDEIAWERRTVAALPAATRLIISNKSTLPWLIDQTPSILLERARGVADRLAEQLALPDISEILVLQSARPTTKDGDYQLTPEDVLPDWFRLELVAERRFGTKLARISRLVAIDLPADFHPSSPPPVSSSEARPAGAPEK